MSVVIDYPFNPPNEGSQVDKPRVGRYPKPKPAEHWDILTPCETKNTGDGMAFGKDKPSRHGLNKPAAAKKRSNLPMVDEVRTFGPPPRPAPESEPVPLIETVQVFCPKCGHSFGADRTSRGRVAGALTGMMAGASMGAKVGIAMGPAGAIAGTVPGAIVGGLFGASVGATKDQAKCPRCSTTFNPPA